MIKQKTAGSRKRATLFDGDPNEQYIHDICVAAGTAFADDEICDEAFKKRIRKLVTKFGLLPEYE